MNRLPIAPENNPRIDPTLTLLQVHTLLSQLQTHLSGAAAGEQLIMSLPPGPMNRVTLMVPCDPHAGGGSAVIPLFSPVPVDQNKIPFVPQMWNYLRPNQIPFTFPPEPIDGKYCFQFVRIGTCTPDCPYVHLSAMEARAYPEYCAAWDKPLPPGWVEPGQWSNGPKRHKPSVEAVDASAKPDTTKKRRKKKKNNKSTKKRKESEKNHDSAEGFIAPPASKRPLSE
jgi:hypothetical protein